MPGKEDLQYGHRLAIALAFILNSIVEVMVTLHVESTTIVGGTFHWTTAPCIPAFGLVVVFLTTRGLTGPSHLCMITVLVRHWIRTHNLPDGRQKL